MPVPYTKMMPVRAWRLVMGLRPGYRNRRGLGGGSIGSINVHRSSSRIGLAMSCLFAQVAVFLPAALFIGTRSSRSLLFERRSKGSALRTGVYRGIDRISASAAQSVPCPTTKNELANHYSSSDPDAGKARYVEHNSGPYNADWNPQRERVDAHRHRLARSHRHRTLEAVC